jgi:HCOMODA/2-hydroxy-3-carboxy-muconic semialdehyde decarboxylase
MVLAAFGALAQQPPKSAGPADPKLIEDLVAANRILAIEGVFDAMGHVSVRHNRDPNRYLISLARAPELVTAEDIAEYDLDSNPVVPPNRRQYSERYIHGEIYKARPDVMAVLHAHTSELVSFGISSVPLRPVWLRANFIGDGLPVYDIRTYTGGYPSPVGCAHCISTAGLGQALAKVIGNEGASLLLGHGTAVVEASIPALVSRAHDMRTNAVIQQMALSLGGRVNYLEGSQSSAGAPNPAAWEYWTHLVSNK